jgi:hypothetical protein
VLALVVAEFGITLGMKSLSEAPVPNAWLEHDLVWMWEAEDPATGRFVASMRDAARACQRRLISVENARDRPMGSCQDVS